MYPSMSGMKSRYEAAGYFKICVLKIYSKYMQIITVNMKNEQHENSNYMFMLSYDVDIVLWKNSLPSLDLIWFDLVW